MSPLRLTTTALFLTAALWPTHRDAAEAQEGDAAVGQAFAEKVCASCHAVLLGQGMDPEPDPLPFKERVPLPFEDIANTPGVTEMALTAWLTTSHPTMPNIVLSEKELRNIVAYILSLKQAR